MGNLSVKPFIAPIAEVMVALVLIDHALRQRGQNGDVVCGTVKLR
jgi:chorismate synthase